MSRASTGWRELASLCRDKRRLTVENGFGTQAELLNDTRLAANAVGASAMDRPEDVESDPVTGRVYVILTTIPNAKRRTSIPPSARPMSMGTFLNSSAGGTNGALDHTADRFQWTFFSLQATPRRLRNMARHAGLAVIARQLRLRSQRALVDASDQGPSKPSMHRRRSLCVDTDGDGRRGSILLRVPRRAECCGPCFTPMERRCLAAIQHPGEGDASSLAEPATRWRILNPICRRAHRWLPSSKTTADRLAC